MQGNSIVPARRPLRRFVVAAAIVMVACFAAPGLAQAHGLVDQSNVPPNNQSSGCGVGGSQFQSFTPTQGTLAAVDLRLAATPTGTYPLTINVRSGSPTGPIVATATTTAFVGALPGTIVHFELASPILLTAGATYVIEWVQTAAGLEWAWYQSTNPYPGGNAFFGCNPPPFSILPDLDDDFAFVTYGLAPLTLAPPTGTNPAGQPHTLTATLLRGTTPAAGETIQFTVTPAATPGPSSGSASTNASGQASFTFSSATVGAFTVTACAVGANGVCDVGEPTATATKTYIDVTPPTCVVVIGANQIHVTANDPESGLTGIAVTARTNVSLSGAPGSFAPPAFGAQVVVATRINRTLPMRLALLVTNAAGLSTPCDPILSTLAIGKRKVVSRSYSGIPYLENKLTIRSLRGGPLRAVVHVNGRAFRFTVKGQKRISLAGAMTHLRANKVKITLYGKAGARALVALTD